MSLVELVFVVIIIGILSAVLAPNFQRESTRQAANQILAHIRYTQHLALIDNKFSNTDQNWYKKRWQIQFSNNSTGTVQSSWKYVIYSDLTLSGNANSKKEVARNPSNPNEYLIGWRTSGMNPTKKLDIGNTFGITDVNLTGGCSSAQRLSFDNLGRPFEGNASSQTSAYQNGRYMTAQCQIVLSGNDGKNITILVEPETGYAHIQ